METSGQENRLDVPAKRERESPFFIGSSTKLRRRARSME
jgi:hypothetical protein